MTEQWNNLVKESSKHGTAVKVKDLKRGDRVMGQSGEWRTVTEIVPFGRGQKLITLDGQPDGAYSDETQVIARAVKGKTE